MDQDHQNTEVTLFLNHHEFVMTYGELCDSWDHITNNCGYEGTGGDWRYIARAIHSLFEQALASQPGVWFSDYKPYSLPPVAIKINQS